jgi:hypothetical protein
MAKTRRILIEDRLQHPVLGPPSRTELGHYNFADGEPCRSDIIEWDDGKAYAIVAKIWPPKGEYAVLVHEI